MKRLEFKLILSMAIHFLWIIFIFYCMIQVEGGTANSICRFFMLTEYSSIAKLVSLVIVYISEYVVYKIKSLESEGEKKIFWLVTALMTVFVAFPVF